jgi:hypothetical protein
LNNQSAAVILPANNNVIVMAYSFRRPCLSREFSPESLSTVSALAGLERESGEPMPVRTRARATQASNQWQRLLLCGVAIDAMTEDSLARRPYNTFKS